MQRSYVTLSTGRQVHYRRSGDGPPLVLLHPSPQSSELMATATTAFGEHCTCYALDTPGYGLSDDLPETEPTMGDYAEALIDAIDAIGIESFYLYGAATGAQLGIEIGKRYPDRVMFLMLDSNGHVSDEDQEKLLEGYFPDVAPKRDGRHLLIYWDMCRHLFAAFPWNSDKPEDQLNFDIPPPTVIHQTLLRYLQAGETYTKAYRNAFRCESRAHLDGLTAPTVMTRWAGSPVLNIADDLIALNLPENVKVLRADLPVGSRYAVQAEALMAAIAERPVSQSKTVKANPSPPGERRRIYLPVGDFQLHAQLSTAGDEPPVVVLHGAGQSSAQMLALASPLFDRRPVLLIDLPGHGGSLDMLPDGSMALTTFAAPISQALTSNGYVGCDIIGVGLGGAIAASIAGEVEARKLLAVDPEPLTKSEQEAYAAHGLPDLTPRMDGSHLVSAWSIVRDGSVYWPWFDRRADARKPRFNSLAPQTLHNKVVDILRLGASWSDVRALEVGLDWQDIVQGLTVPGSLAVTDRHPNIDRIQNLASAEVGCFDLTDDAVGEFFVGSR